MQKLFAVELVFAMVILLFTKGQSLQCYICRSDVHSGCEGNMNESLAGDCPQKENGTAILCRKMQQKLKFKNEENWTIIRECGYEEGPSNCYNFKWVELGYQETCECKEEKCNGGSSHIPNIMLLAVFLFLLVMFNYSNCDNT